MSEVTAAKIRRDLHDITLSLERFLEFLDEEMRKPSTEERGRRIARASNQMEMLKDQIKHFTLGLPLDKPMKPRK